MFCKTADEFKAQSRNDSVPMLVLMNVLKVNLLREMKDKMLEIDSSVSLSCEIYKKIHKAAVALTPKNANLADFEIENYQKLIQNFKVKQWLQTLDLAKRGYDYNQDYQNLGDSVIKLSKEKFLVVKTNAIVSKKQLEGQKDRGDLISKFFKL